MWMFSPPASVVRNEKRYIIGVAAMEAKARSKPMRNILQRLIASNDFDAIIFGDKVILDEQVENWPQCDLLISFFSTGFPLQKAIDYVRLRNPFCINHLGMQKMLMDRRLVLLLLDALNVPTPKRIIVHRDGGPVLPEDAMVYLKKLKVNLELYKPEVLKLDLIQLDDNSIMVGDNVLTKPFVEKPVSGEDHNIWIYYPGGGVRKLFRKVANKASEFVSGLHNVRTEGSFVYEEFMDVDNSEDVKLYTVGDYIYAETRKSPVVDGIVLRTPDGKEMRQVCSLSKDEQSLALKVSEGFGQTVCGLDLLRVNSKSYVIDVNGWSFVKGSDEYYDQCSKYIRQIFLKARRRRPTNLSKEVVFENHWRLKGIFSVLRHGDRTPKQKLKFYVASQPFIDLLNGSVEEVTLKKSDELLRIYEVAKEAKASHVEDDELMDSLIMILEKKLSEPGTKVQVKPQFNKEDGLLEKIQIIVKWGGEFTHAGHHHSKDLGENLRKDLLIVNKDVFQDIYVYSSSERRVLATCEVFLKSFLDLPSYPKDIVQVRKDMLDDSYDAKEQMDEVKLRLQKLLIPEFQAQVDGNSPLGNFSEFVSSVISLMKSRRSIMKEKYDKIDVNSIQKEWCCSESPQLFKERWDRLFREICDVDISSFDLSKVSELYDSLKYDALHNRTFIEEVFVDKTEQETDPRAPLRELYQKTKMLFDYIGPREYGITDEEKLEIGFLTSVTLLKQIIEDIQSVSKSSSSPAIRLYFTKESHVHTLYNVIRLWFAPGIQEISELDYLTQITLELYERLNKDTGNVEYSIRVGFSPGADASGLIDTKMDETHSLSVAPRRWMSDHINLDEALKPIIGKLSMRHQKTSVEPKLRLRRLDIK